MEIKKFKSFVKENYDIHEDEYTPGSEETDLDEVETSDTGDGDLDAPESDLSDDEAEGSVDTGDDVKDDLKSLSTDTLSKIASGEIDVTQLAQDILDEEPESDIDSSEPDSEPDYTDGDFDGSVDSEESSEEPEHGTYESFKLKNFKNFKSK